MTVLVLVGIDPESRKRGGYASGGAVPVHAACAGVPDKEPQRLTSGDPEPAPGTVVRDDLGREWGRDGDGGSAPWTRTDGTDDPESWTKVAGNYGPVTVLERE